MYLQDIGEECKNDAFYGGVTTKIYEQNVKKKYRTGDVRRYDTELARNKSYGLL